MEKRRLKEKALVLITRARENLVEMETLLERDLYFGGVNRGYYAIFHAISALLILLEDKQFSKHKSIISYFGKHYSRTGRVPKHYHRVFLDAFEIRQKADYDYHAIVNKEQAEEIAANAKEIVKYVESKIHE